MTSQRPSQAIIMNLSRVESNSMLVVYGFPMTRSLKNLSPSERVTASIPLTLDFITRPPFCSILSTSFLSVALWSYVSLMALPSLKRMILVSPTLAV
ncbi:hypothetical protein WICPIJ_008071 [Wickerhamomyces pijperi]|uniref:Uncharacterized protein n=1 Tax=Wickerhamomyces pijperi TaxID=599730 RepID=A0A9P8PYU4_WICPI|nr:hypothetical protein WICPIJ_008071 [Wickerhamomyces pijperi]